MDGSFSTGLTSFPLFIEIKNNVDGLVTFATDATLSQQLELILAEPITRDEVVEQPVENVVEEEDDSNIDVKDFLKYNNDTSNTVIKNTNDEFSAKQNDDNGNNFKCNECSENFDTKEIYDIHMSGHSNNMKCAICNMVLKSLKNYEKHCLRCKPYECQICGRVVRFRPNFIKHMRVHTGQQSERHKYKCEVCQKEFMSFEYFKVHKKIHNENVNLTCDVCGKVFSALASLRGHSKLHTGVKLHKCDVCGKGFGQRYNLKIHSRVHTGEIPYECGVCKRKLHTQSSYQNHMQSHQKDQESQTTTITTITDKKLKKDDINPLKLVKVKVEINDDKGNEKKIKFEKETQTVVQNIDKYRNKYIVIPTSTKLAKSTSTSSATTVVSHTIPTKPKEQQLFIRNESHVKEGPVKLCHNIIKYDTNLFKLNSMNPKLNQIIIKSDNIDNNDRDDDTVDINDDNDDDDNLNGSNIILGKCTKILNTGDCNKFQTQYFENDFNKNLNDNNGNNNDDNDDDDLMSNNIPYSNIFECSAISNSITNDVYLDNERNNDDDDHNPLIDLQSTIITTTSTATTDGNFIKKEWIYSNSNNYSSIAKFTVDDDDDDDNEFSEAASFIYD